MKRREQVGEIEGKDLGTFWKCRWKRKGSDHHYDLMTKFWIFVQLDSLFFFLFINIVFAWLLHCIAFGGVGLFGVGLGKPMEGIWRCLCL